MTEEFDFGDLAKSKRLKLRVKLGVIAFLLIGLLIVGLYLAFGSKKLVKAIPQKTSIELGSVNKVHDVDKMWRHKLEENLENNNSDLINKIGELKTDLMKSSKAIESKKDEEISSLKEKLKFLEAEFGEVKKQDTGMKIENTEQISKITKYNVMLNNPKNVKDYKPLKTADNYIAAGSFVKGALLSGMDVSTSIKTISDPEPTLIRLTDYGNLPRKFKSDVKDCHIVASAYGDLSSERAKIRIEKLSCTEISSGEIIETEVAGYATGEDGRSGLRGQVVSVDQKYLINAQIFGTLGGIAKNAGPEQQVFNPFNMTANNQVGMGDKVKGNLATGAGSSLDKLAEYYIDRAESIQPVIQVSAGRKIDVIFTEGVYFGTSQLKTHLAKKREEKLKSTIDQESNMLINQMEKK